MYLNPLLAYPLNQIDPTGTFAREEGAVRLPPLRAALYQLGNNAHERLCESSGSNTLVAALSPSTRLHANIHAAIFSANAPWQPSVCMLAPTARVFAPQFADAMTEQERVQCIPISGDSRGSVAFPQWPLPSRKRVLAHFDAQRVGIGGHASLSFERLGAEDLIVRAVSSNGKRSEWRSAVTSVVLDQLFACSTAVLTQGVATRVPCNPGELPQMLMDEVADFWQRVARCHVVSSVCAPKDATRPLGFGSIKVKCEGTRVKRAVVRAKLHHSSCACACDLWKLKPVGERMPMQRFVSSEVELVVGMCGRVLDPQSKLCPLHGEATPLVPLLDNICCHDTVAELHCLHLTGTKGPPIAGLRLANMQLRGLNVLHAQVLIASCLRCTEDVAPLLGKRPPAEILKACDVECRNARIKLDEVARRRAASAAVLSATALQALDMKAHDLLRQGGVRQYARPSTGKLVLARSNPDGSNQVLLKGEGAELVHTHLGLFPPPLKRKRRR
jgi:hypothetical protein